MSANPDRTDSDRIDTVRANFERYMGLANDYRTNPEFRARVESDPAGVLEERGIETPSGVDLRVVVDTAETHHLILPPDPNTMLDDGELAGVSGGVSGGEGTIPPTAVAGPGSTTTHNPWLYHLNNPCTYNPGG